MQRLETTTDLLDALQERYGWTSDRQIAKGLDIPQATVSSWRCGRSFPTEEHAFTVADALGISPAYVVLIGAADRSARTSPATHSEWRKMVRQIARGGAVAVAALLIGTGSYSPPAKSDDLAHTYSVKSRRRRPAHPEAA